MITETWMEECDNGHRFAVWSGHPMRDGRSRCSTCLAIGVDKAVAAYNSAKLDTPSLVVGEPVAWMSPKMGLVINDKSKRMHDTEGTTHDFTIPLYAHPQVREVGEEEIERIAGLYLDHTKTQAWASAREEAFINGLRYAINKGLAGKADPSLVDKIMEVVDDWITDPMQDLPMQWRQLAALGKHRLRTRLTEMLSKPSDQ